MFNNHVSYNRMYREGELTLGLHIPLENFKMRTPTLERQVELAQRADDYGFTALWLRDVLLKDPNFLDPAVGQIYDMLIYGTHLLGQTKRIALGTSALVLPLRRPSGRLQRTRGRPCDTGRAVQRIAPCHGTGALPQLSDHRFVVRRGP